MNFEQKYFKLKKINQSGGRRIEMNIASELYTYIYNLLWLDTRASNIELIFNQSSEINKILTKIMYQLGATEELLNLKCFAKLFITIDT